MKKVIPILLSAALILSLFSGCGNANNSNSATNNSTTSTGTSAGSSAEAAEADFSQTDAEPFTGRDYEADYDASKAVTIQLNGNSATASSDSVKISGSTIRITEDTTHIITGTLNDGMIIVEADDTAKLQLVLNGVNINSKTSAALYIISADKVFVTLADGTENTLSNGGSFEAIDESNIDGAVFSKQDLTFNGSGTLTVTSPVGHGIVCKDDLVFTSGSYKVTSASHGLDANDSVRITSAAITIDAGKDGIHSENTDDASLGFVYISSGSMNIEAEGDGVFAGAYLQIESGTIQLLTGGGYKNGTKASSGSYGGFMGGGRPGRSASSAATDESSTSMKGLKAVSGILISDGTITIDSADDSIHSDASIIINGGIFKIASGDDGVHAENTLTITACNMNVSQSYEGLEAQTIYLKGGDIEITASDDGINASGGTDSSGTTGGRDGMFGGMGGKGGMGGEMSGSSNGVIEISGGKLTVYAGGDGLDSNGSLTISGGYVYVANPTAGDTSVLDADISPIITGGTFISTGSTTMMAQSFDTSSTQGVIACTTGTQSAGSTITVKDSIGNTIISYEAEYTYVLVIISSPDIVKGETYTLTVGSSATDITMTETVYGSGGSIGGMGGRR